MRNGFYWHFFPRRSERPVYQGILLVINAILLIQSQSIGLLAIASPTTIDCKSDVRVSTATDGYRTVAWPLSPLLAIGDRVTLRERNQLNGLWTVSTRDGSTVTVPSMHFSAVDKYIAMPVHPRGEDVGCTAIVLSQGNTRRGVARLIAQQLSRNEHIVSVVLANVKNDENARFDRDFELSLKADRAPIVVLRTAVDVSYRWVMPDELVGTHCVLMLDDKSLPTTDAIDCLARAAINAHAANSTTVQFGLGGAALLSETDTFERISVSSVNGDGQYNIILSTRSSFSRYRCIREWFEQLSAEVFDIMALHKTVHCDDVLVSLLLVQHGFNARLLVGASFTSTTDFGGRISERHQSTPVECFSQLRGAMSNNALRLATTSAVLPCTARPRPPNRVLHVVVMSNEFFSATRSTKTIFGGFAQAASMYIGANFANDSFADFGAVGRVAITFVYGMAWNPPDFDHNHPVLSTEAFIADVENGVREPPALIWTVDLSRPYVALLRAFRDVPVLVWARNPVVNEVKEHRATLRLPTLPTFLIPSAMNRSPDPQAVLQLLTPAKRPVFIGVLDPLMTGSRPTPAEHALMKRLSLSVCAIQSA